MGARSACLLEDREIMAAINNAARLLALICVVVGVAACDHRDAPAVMTNDDKALLDEVRTRRAERMQLTAHPGTFIGVSGKWDKVDRGIINDYSQATAITFANTSHFDVSSIVGKLTYLDAHGREVATVPFVADGQVDAGATKKLSVKAGEVTGAAEQLSVIVEHVTVHGN